MLCLLYFKDKAFFMESEASEMKKLFYVLMGLCLVAPVGAQGIVDSQTRALIDRMDRLERDLTLVQRKIRYAVRQHAN